MSTANKICQQQSKTQLVTAPLLIILYLFSVPLSFIVRYFKWNFQSEERGKEEYAANEKPQDTRIARSAGNSLDKLAGSSADPDGELIDIIRYKNFAVLFLLGALFVRVYLDT